MPRFFSSLVVLAACWTSTLVHAQSPGLAAPTALSTHFASVHEAAKALFPDHSPWLWTAVDGDLNGDGINDKAAIIVINPVDGYRENRLLMLTGTADQRYRVLSVSARYCDAQKFFNLDVKDGMLWVEQVNYADPTRWGAITRMFRVHPKHGDLEWVRSEIESHSDDDQSFELHEQDRVSGAVHERVQSEGITRTELSRQPVPLPVMLHGLECED